MLRLLLISLAGLTTLACSLATGATPTAPPPAADEGVIVQLDSAPTRTPIGESAALPPAATPTDGPPAAVNNVGGAANASAAGDCPPPSGWSATYTVQSGDTLFAIAQDNETDYPTLAQANCLPDAQQIEVGQVLVVPGDRGDGGSTVVLERRAVVEAPAVQPPASSDRILTAPQSVTVYRALSEADGRAGGIPVGCGGLLVPETMAVFGAETATARVQEALTLLLSLTAGADGTQNFLLGSGLAIERVQVADGVATVALTGQVRFAGACEIPLIRGQLQETILADAAVSEARITINGESLDAVFSQR